MEEELLLQKIMCGFTQIQLAALIQEDTSIVCGIMLRDVLEKESSKPGNGWDLRWCFHTTQQSSKMISKKHATGVATTPNSVNSGILILGSLTSKN
jgi:hypothetical protein